jgi:hypothetical protein
MTTKIQWTDDTVNPIHLVKFVNGKKQNGGHIWEIQACGEDVRLANACIKKHSSVKQESPVTA